MLNRFKKKISRTAYCLCIVCVAAIFFAVITVTPVSNIMTSVLADGLKSAFDTSDKSEESAAGFGDFLFALSFPGISGANNQNALSGGNSETDASADKNTGNAGLSERYNPYAKDYIKVTDDNSILSIYDLYEHYGAASGVKIEDATPSALTASDIPDGFYEITPKNYSGQKTITPKLLIINNSSFDIDLYDYLSRKYPVGSYDPQKKEEPVVLILDTHTTESFVEEGVAYYSPPFTAERTSDLNKNIALVATELRKKLEEYGIPVIQSTKLHDEPSFMDSYVRSLETMNEYIAQYPSIKYVIDVHRDSMIASDGEKFKPTVKINGKDCAQIMMVIGTDDGGAYHPNWRDNLTFATHLQQKMNDTYPMLARPINLRDARFNQHVTLGSIILEVGSCGSTFNEALYAADLFGQCLAELILQNND